MYSIMILRKNWEHICMYNCMNWAKKKLTHVRIKTTIA